MFFNAFQAQLVKVERKRSTEFMLYNMFRKPVVTAGFVNCGVVFPAFYTEQYDVGAWFKCIVTVCA